MICPLLTYLDMHQAMAELEDVFGLEVVWLGSDAAEIRWDGGVAVAQADQPEALHGGHAGHGWTYVRVADPDAHYARALSRGAHILNEPHSGPAVSAATAPATGRETSGPSHSTSSAASHTDCPF